MNYKCSLNAPLGGGPTMVPESFANALPTEPRGDKQYSL